MIVVALLQAVAGPQLPAPPRPVSDRPCPIAADTDDVVVCARPNDRYRLPRVATAPDRQLIPRAEMRIGSAALATEAEQATLAGGAQSQRLMVRLKIPFGAGRKP